MKFWCLQRKLAQLLSGIGILSASFSGIKAKETRPPNVFAKNTHQGTIQRRVLIFEFGNRTGKSEYDYLSGSIAEAIDKPIENTRKFIILSREKVFAVTEPSKPGTNTVSKSQEQRSVSATQPRQPGRDEAIQLGKSVGADVVVLGYFAELNSVLLISAQVYETDTRLMKVSESVLTSSSSDMFKGINQLVEKIAESMARELPMFDEIEAEMRRAEANRKLNEDRDWEFQIYGAFQLMHGIYSTDGTIASNKGFPVDKLSGYALGLNVWQGAWPKKIFFFPKGARFGLTTRIAFASGFADVYSSNGSLVSHNAKINAQFFSSGLLVGVPYYERGQFHMYADIGSGAMYGSAATTRDTIFASVMPGVLVGTTAAYYFPYWSLGVGYRAQVWFMSSYTAFMAHDAYLYIGLRI